MNWKQREDYEHTNDFNKLEWAWEFLRRNKKYCQDYNNWIKKYDLTQWDIDHFSKKYWDTLGKRAETLNENVRLTRGHWYRKKYHLQQPCDPRLSALEHSRKNRLIFDVNLYTLTISPIIDGIPSPALLPKDFHLCLDRINQPQVAVVFDLTKPLSKQCDQIKKFLLAEQKRLRDEGLIEFSKPKNHPNLWGEYLRVLDAINDGATHQEIYDVIYKESATYQDRWMPETGLVKDKIEQARKLVNGGYVDIIEIPKHYMEPIINSDL